MRRRFQYVLAFLAFGFAMVLAQLAYLQIWRHGDLTARATQQAQRWVKEAPRRAPLLDRDGIPLAESVPIASCYADPTLLPSISLVAARLAPALGTDPHRLARALREARGSCIWG